MNMNGKIIEVEDQWVGVQVIDSNGTEHKVAVEFDGSIKGHSQNGYPDDADERSHSEG